MTEDQIKYMVARFLGWRLPESFNPDGGISFKKFGNKGTPYQYERQPSGTNVLDATQADAMVRFMIEGLPKADSVTLAKRPVAFRVRDCADGWIIYQDEEQAYKDAEARGALMQGLYARDGS